MNFWAARYGSMVLKGGTTWQWEVWNVMEKTFEGIVEGGQGVSVSWEIFEKVKVTKREVGRTYTLEDHHIWAVHMLRSLNQIVSSNCQSYRPDQDMRHYIFTKGSHQANWNDGLKNSNGAMMTLTLERYVTGVIGSVIIPKNEVAIFRIMDWTS